MAISRLVVVSALAALFMVGACGDDGGTNPASACDVCNDSTTARACDIAVDACIQQGVEVDLCIQTVVQSICG